MKKILFSAMAIGGLIMASCSQDVYEAPVQEAFSKTFTEVFGQIDPNEDWNAFETRTITIVGNGNDVNVYTFDGDVWKCSESFSPFTGSKTVEISAPKAYEEVLVSSAGQSVRVKDGGTASFASTRAILDSKDGVFTELTDYTTFTTAEIRKFIDLLPERSDNRNVEGLTHNFSARQKPNQKVKVYPVYWNGSYYHTFGIYTVGADGKPVETEIFTTRRGDDMCQYRIGNAGWKNFETSMIESTYEAFPASATEIRVKGAEITIPEGTDFGFYIEVSTSKPSTGNKPNGNNGNNGNGGNNSSSTKKFYSEAKYNDEGKSQASFFRAKLNDESFEARTFLGFEDIAMTDTGNNYFDADLNDVVILFDPEPEIMNQALETTMRFACEDLGSTDDYDYNDVVFQVTYTRKDGKTTDMTVTPLAAGGTFDAYICYDDKEIGEIHDLLGGPRGSFINTQHEGKAGAPVSVTPDPDFTVATANMVTGGHLRGFSVRVPSNNMQLVMPQKGDAPMMMCVPATWKWPVERDNINLAYPKFNTYGSGATSSEWYLSKNRNDAFQTLDVLK